MPQQSCSFSAQESQPAQLSVGCSGGMSLSEQIRDCRFPLPCLKPTDQTEKRQDEEDRRKREKEMERARVGRETLRDGESLLFITATS